MSWRNNTGAELNVLSSTWIDDESILLQTTISNGCANAMQQVSQCFMQRSATTTAAPVLYIAIGIVLAQQAHSLASAREIE